MTERSTGLPSPEQVIELLDGEFARAGYEVDHVTIDTHAKPARITVVADGDIPLDLDTIAELSRSASALLDGLDTGETAYARPEIILQDLVRALMLIADVSRPLKPVTKPPSRPPAKKTKRR